MQNMHADTPVIGSYSNLGQFAAPISSKTLFDKLTEVTFTDLGD